MSRKRKHVTPLEFAVNTARQREADARAIKARGGEVKERGHVQLRLLICNRCHSVWPTERDPAHGGSRQDNEPCAYRWPDGKVCQGTVGPMWGRRAKDEWSYAPRERAAYSGSWCETLGVPRGTTDLALVRKRYRALVIERHPDQGGSHEAMVRLNLAYQQALAELGQP